MKKLKLIFGLLMVVAFVAVTVISTSTVDNSAIKKNVPIPTGM